MHNLLVSTHVGKCAGSSFRLILFEIYGEEKVLIDHSSPGGYEIRNPIDWKEKIELGEIRAVHGHTAHIDKWSSVFPDADYITWVRDPVDRIVSQYYYEKRIGKEDITYPPNYKDLMEYVKEHRNWQTELFVPFERVDNYSFIGIVEIFDDCLEVFYQRFANGKKAKSRRENINPIGNSYRNDLRSDILRAIEELNRRDMELFLTVKEKWKNGEYKL